MNINDIEILQFYIVLSYYIHYCKCTLYYNNKTAGKKYKNLTDDLVALSKCVSEFSCIGTAKTIIRYTFETCHILVIYCQNNFFFHSSDVVFNKNDIINCVFYLNINSKFH